MYLCTQKQARFFHTVVESGEISVPSVFGVHAKLKRRWSSVEARRDASLSNRFLLIYTICEWLSFPECWCFRAVVVFISNMIYRIVHSVENCKGKLVRVKVTASAILWRFLCEALGISSNGGGAKKLFGESMEFTIVQCFIIFYLFYYRA